jgi:glycosyltransferase involved in cell wall biosynthesis
VDQPFVSIIIPAYNGDVFLAEAVRSIQQQNYHPLEIIIVDEGSTDGTTQVAASFKD